MAYNDLDSKVSQNWKISDVDAEWEYRTKLELEQVIAQSTGAKIRVATVSVRRVGDDTERYQIKTAVTYLPTNSNLGEYENLPSSGVAKSDDFIVAAGSRRNHGEDLNVVVDGVLRGFVIHRDYGTGPISVTVPIKKGSTYSIYGSVVYKYFIPLNKF